MNRAGTEDLVLIGRVTGAHALRGEIKIRPYSGEPDSLRSYSCLLLAKDNDAVPVPHKVVQVRKQKDCALVQLEDCRSRTEAELLARAAVYVERNALPVPDEDEFYLHDLTGRQMKTAEGQLVGTIAGLLLGGGQDIAQVNGADGQEYLIPLVPEFIVAVEAEAVIVSLPPGLLEINA
jgi:16S rRNA processing protein RimM